MYLKNQKNIEDIVIQTNSLYIYTENDIFEHIPLGHPYRPKYSAILLVKKGNVKLKEQINLIEMTDNSLILIDTKNVYEILEMSGDLEIRSILGLHKKYVRNRA